MLYIIFAIFLGSECKWQNLINYKALFYSKKGLDTFRLY